MNYSCIRKMDISNGPGIGVSLFVQGCDRAWNGCPCKGCFNEQTWDPCGGKPYTNNETETLIRLLEPDYISHFSILGGEPLDPGHIEDLLKICREVKQHHPNKPIWLWTGYTFEKLWEKYEMNGMTTTIDQLLWNVDVLVDGPFVENMKSPDLKWAGSVNQRVLDCKKTLQQGKAVLL